MTIKLLMKRRYQQVRYWAVRRQEIIRALSGWEGLSLRVTRTRYLLERLPLNSSYKSYWYFQFSLLASSPPLYRNDAWCFPFFDLPFFIAVLCLNIPAWMVIESMWVRWLLREKSLKNSSMRRGFNNFYNIWSEKRL